MPEYTVASANGATDIDADNWMIALGLGLPKLGVQMDHAFRWVVSPSAAGAVSVEDTQSGVRYFVKPRVMVKMVVARGAEAADAEPSGLPPENEGLPPEDPVIPPPAPEESVSAEPPPMLTMPLTSSLAPPPGATIKRKTTDTDTIGERLFELTTDMAGASPEEASALALKLLQDLMPSEASSVARGSIADFHLTIVAATGPVAEQLKGRIVPFGEGYVGLCFDARVAIQVNDVGNDARHHVNLDAETGFVTRRALCVPIVKGDDIYGVIQVLNPENPFIQEDTEVAAQVAQALAEALSSNSDMSF